MRLAHLSPRVILVAMVTMVAMVGNVFADPPAPILVKTLCNPGSLPGHVNSPRGMFVDAAGNLYVAEVETPRSDAGIGLFLKGDGKGSFSSVPAFQSGLYLPYDVKNLAWLKSTRGPVVLVGANNEAMKAVDVKLLD